MECEEELDSMCSKDEKWLSRIYMKTHVGSNSNNWYS